MEGIHVTVIVLAVSPKQPSRREWHGCPIRVFQTNIRRVRAMRIRLGTIIRPGGKLTPVKSRSLLHAASLYTVTDTKLNCIISLQGGKWWVSFLHIDFYRSRISKGAPVNNQLHVDALSVKSNASKTCLRGNLTDTVLKHADINSKLMKLQTSGLVQQPRCWRLLSTRIPPKTKCPLIHFLSFW